MDFNRRISQLEDSIKSVAMEAQSLKEALKRADNFTAKFLADCSKAGIKKVGIDRVPEEMREAWPFGGQGSVFGIGRDTKTGWPAIWGVVQRAGIYGGCGNSDQAQADTSNLISGVYEIKDGKWRRLEDRP